MKEFVNFEMAFSYCREKQHPVVVKIRDNGVFKIYPSGKAVRRTKVKKR